MIRKIIRIDKEKCNGCGACADACHEGAIDIINGKAELVREHFCDGLGDCLPECPTGAISFEEREAPEYDEEAVKEAQKKIFAKNQAITAYAGCPGSKSMQIQRSEIPKSEKPSSTTGQVSNLQNWPVQIKLAPVSAPYFNGAKLLIAADCTDLSCKRQRKFRSRQLSGTEDKQRELPKRIHSTDTERQKHRIQQRGTGENACGNL